MPILISSLAAVLQGNRFRGRALAGGRAKSAAVQGHEKGRLGLVTQLLAAGDPAAATAAPRPFLSYIRGEVHWSLGFGYRAVEAEEKRLQAAQRKRSTPGAWKGRLGVLTQQLLAAGHPAAGEVAALLGYADQIDDIPGFFEPALLETLARLHVHQRDHSVAGHVAEIGVYYGRGFIPLAMLCAGQETAVGIDLFEEPERPEDNSGIGCLQATWQNIQDCMLTGDPQTLPDRVVLMKKDSRYMAHTDIRVAASKALPQSSDAGVRLFSIDGCHTARATKGDLRLAAASLADGGVVILDDVFNADWPETSLGLALFMEGFLYEQLQIGGNQDALMPFCIGHNKVMLCQPSWHDQYFQLLRDAPGCRKEAKFFGSPVAVHPQGWLAAFAGNDEFRPSEN